MPASAIRASSCAAHADGADNAALDDNWHTALEWQHAVHRAHVPQALRPG
jgi:hypothetical protein